MELTLSESYDVLGRTAGDAERRCIHGRGPNRGVLRRESLRESGSTVDDTVAMKASRGTGAGSWMGVPSQQDRYLTD